MENNTEKLPCSATVERYGSEVRVRLSITIDGVKYEESGKGFETGPAATRALQKLSKAMKRAFFE